MTTYEYVRVNVAGLVRLYRQDATDAAHAGRRQAAEDYTAWADAYCEVQRVLDAAGPHFAPAELRVLALAWWRAADADGATRKEYERAMTVTRALYQWYLADSPTEEEFAKTLRREARGQHA